MEVSLQWLREVVARHTPAFYIHPADRFLPCTVEYFLANSRLVRLPPAGSSGTAADGGADGSPEVLLPPGSVTGEALLEVQRAHRGQPLRIDLLPAARGGAPLEELDSVPVYAHVKAVVGVEGGVEALEINYLTLYAYNGPYRVGGLKWVETGAHDGDWEHVTARVDPASGELQGMWYNAHRSRDGGWVEACKVPQDPESGRHVAYVALHGHGTYPGPGTIPRHFFLGNDKTRGDGPKWRPSSVVLLPSVSPPPLTAEGAPEAPATTAAQHGGDLVLDTVQAPADGSSSPGRQRRTLRQVRSRGSSLQASGDRTTQPGSEKTEGDCGEGALGCSSSCSSAEQAAGVDVVTHDPCTWLQFEGEWGTIDAPISQGWLHTAEPPVSRSPLLRIFCHFWPETECV